MITSNATKPINKYQQLIIKLSKRIDITISSDIIKPGKEEILFVKISLKNSKGEDIDDLMLTIDNDDNSNIETNIQAIERFIKNYNLN